MKKENAVANLFILFGIEDENAEYITNLKLNKLMYFADAWSLILFDRPLFNEPILAWKYGPVVPSIYHKYKSMGKKPIMHVDNDFNLSLLSDDELQLISSVMAQYGKFSAEGLVDLTHAPGAPWEKIYYSDAQAKVIGNELIKTYFSRQPRLKLSGSLAEKEAAGYRNSDGVLVLPAEWNDMEDYGRLQ